MVLTQPRRSSSLAASRKTTRSLAVLLVSVKVNLRLPPSAFFASTPWIERRPFSFFMDSSEK
jgi:hypothetical protein